jgi:hypothetical protein
MHRLSVDYRLFLARSLDTIGRRDLRYKLVQVSCKLQPLKWNYWVLKTCFIFKMFSKTSSFNYLHTFERFYENLFFLTSKSTDWPSI